MSDIRFSSDDLLIEVMDDLMNEEVSAIPTERQIAAMHTWSDAHKEEMDYILEHGRRRMKKAEKSHFHGMNRWATQAAAIALILVVGSLAIVSTGLFGRKGMGSMAPAMAPAAGTTEESAVAEDVMWEAAEAEEEAGAPPEMPAEESYSEGSLNSAETDETKQVNNKEISLVYQQEIASESDDKKISLTCAEPLLDRMSDELTLSITNNETYDIRYYQDMDVHVLIDGRWYEIDLEKEGEDVEFLTLLEAGETREEVLDLSAYELERDCEKYRIVVYFEDQILASEFSYKEK